MHPLVDDYGYAAGEAQRHDERAKLAQSELIEAEAQRKAEEQKAAFINKVENEHTIPKEHAGQIVKNVAIIARTKAEAEADYIKELAGVPITIDKVEEELKSMGELDAALLEGKGSVDPTKVEAADPRSNDIRALKSYVQFYYSSDFRGPKATADDLSVLNTEYKNALHTLGCIDDQLKQNARLSADTMQNKPGWEKTVEEAEARLAELAAPIEQKLLEPYQDRLQLTSDRMHDAEALFDFAHFEMPEVTFLKTGRMMNSKVNCGTVNQWMEVLDPVISQMRDGAGRDESRKDLKNELKRHAQFMIQQNVDYKKGGTNIVQNDGRDYDPDMPYPTRIYGHQEAIATTETAKQLATDNGNAKWADMIESQSAQNNQLAV
ncbi:MAG: hypothetical protein MRY32_09630 [Rickettsiales bacterium]|nr:hypothetical protein [Rickettsiales bacterium]